MTVGGRMPRKGMTVGQLGTAGNIPIHYLAAENICFFFLFLSMSGKRQLSVFQILKTVALFCHWCLYD